MLYYEFTFTIRRYDNLADWKSSKQAGPLNSFFIFTYFIYTLLTILVCYLIVIELKRYFATKLKFALLLVFYNLVLFAAMIIDFVWILIFNGVFIVDDTSTL